MVCRWASAGAFYPFSRNHYTYFARPHEYYRWPDVAASAKKAYGLRYRLLTYIYSNLYLAHTRGGPVAKPLLFTDPADVRARYGFRALGCTCCQTGCLSVTPACAQGVLAAC